MTEPPSAEDVVDLMVTEDELDQLSWSEWEPDRWLEDEVDLEPRIDSTWGSADSFDPPDDVAEIGQPAAPLDSRTAVLRALLLVNVILIGLAFLLPQGDGSAGAPGRGGALHGTTGRILPGVPAGVLFEEALTAMGRGDYRGPVPLLERLLATSAGLSELERRVVRGQLAFCLMMDGRYREAHDRRLDPRRPEPLSRR